MKRSTFLKQTLFGILGLVVIPKVFKKESSGLIFDGVDQSVKTDDLYNGFDFSNIECFYDFTNDKYSIKDNKGNIIGWKDLSGNGHHGIINTVNPKYPYKKFAISKKINETWTDEFAERMLKFNPT